MDFLANQQGSAPVVTAATLLEVILGRQGLTAQDVAMKPNVLLAITPHSLRVLRGFLDLAPVERCSIAGAGIYHARREGFSVVGPAVGAPVAANVLEALAALGARRVIAIGWCGSLQATLQAGALVVPRSALREEGVSYHYSPAEVPAEASPAMVELLLATSEAAGQTAVAGPIWTTDALYREARAKVCSLAAAGVLAVEMEASALFVVAAHLALECGLLLAVSDELGGTSWQPHFFEDGFQAAHLAACRIAVSACSRLSLGENAADKVPSCT